MINSIQNRASIGNVMALGFLLAAVMAACLLVARPAYASTTFTVDRNDDPDPATAKACTAAEGDCSLRGAIVAANAAAGADDITLPADTYTLTIAGANEDASYTGDLDVTDELTINGAGARSTSVVGGPAPYDDRIFENRWGATTTITGLTITGGKGGGGGGIFNNGSDLTLDRVAVKGNTSGSVGGILGFGGTLTLTDSTVSGNSAGSFGGVATETALVNITNSTISGNKASETGLSGGVFAADGTLMNIRNSTIANNQSGRPGGGIVTHNGSAVIVKNTIVAGNSVSNCDTAQLAGGIISSQGNNISTDDSCPFTKSTDKQNTGPLLSPLQNNGGPTDTRALLTGSPAIDAGSNVDCPATDQRGVARPQRIACDIGAFELRNSPPVASDDAYNAREDTTLTSSTPGVLANDADAEGDTLRASVLTGPGKGMLTLRADGSFTYRPKANLNGTDSFTYRASDGHGGTDTATVTIEIAAVNDAAVITPISPAPGVSTTDQTPLIRAKVRDVETNVAKANIKLFVDRRGVPASRFVYDPSTDVLSHTPARALSLGKHTVKVVATDTQAKSTTRQWSFKVVERSR